MGGSRPEVVVLTPLPLLPDEWVLADGSRIARWRLAHETHVYGVEGAEHMVMPSVDHVGLMDRYERFRG